MHLHLHLYAGHVHNVQLCPALSPNVPECPGQRPGWTFSFCRTFAGACSPPNIPGGGRVMCRVFFQVDHAILNGPVLTMRAPSLFG